jgi:hypothetical protein
MMGCICPKGWAASTDDCDDTRNFVYPGAPELCNYIDDNCNGQIDEGAITTCGLGWCRRNGAGCNTMACTPGKPRAEICNDFDDDCDGVDDNGTDLQLCGGPGLKCVRGTCVPSDAAVTEDDGGAGSSGAAGATGSSGGAPGETGSAGSTGAPDPGGAAGGAAELPARAHAGCALAPSSRGSSAGPWLGLVAIGLAARRRRARH